MQHSLKLKQNIGEFVDQNPQIAAKLVQSWLRGEVGDIAETAEEKKDKTEAAKGPVDIKNMDTKQKQPLWLSPWG